MTVRLITATAVLLLALVVASSALAHSEKPPPKHGCRIRTHPTGHCFAVGRTIEPSVTVSSPLPGATA
jgi:hypothetical protein